MATPPATCESIREGERTTAQLKRGKSSDARYAYQRGYHHRLCNPRRWAFALGIENPACARTARPRPGTPARTEGAAGCGADASQSRDRVQPRGVAHLLAGQSDGA